MNSLNVFHQKVFSVSFVIDEKTTTAMKSLSIYFEHHSLAFLNSFLNILNKYNFLILNKYYLEQVICYIHEFDLAILWDRWLMRWGPRAEGRGTQTPQFFNFSLLNNLFIKILSLFVSLDELKNIH